VDDADGDGPGKRRALLEFYAMCFLGQINYDKRGRILWITGEPGTGKSTLIDSLNKALFPPEFMAMVDPKAFSDSQQLLDLVGKLLNFADEVDEKTITNAALIRKVIAGNEMKVRQLYKGFFNARMRAGHIMVANLMPRQADESGALIDRTIHLHFTHRFKRRNESAEDVMRQIVAERAGIINLLLETYFEIQARPPELRNVQAPESAKRRRQEMLEDANIFKNFVKILKFNPDAKRRSTDLLKLFNLYKATHGYIGGPNVTSGVLAKKVLELRPELKVGESGGAAWYGFDVADDSGQVPSAELN
jgi:phage/plasmid-associated DNA primase